MAKRAMSWRQEKFVDAYVGEAEGNATKAAEIAGYAHPHETSAKVMKAACVRERIEATVMRHLNGGMVLQKLAEQAQFDLSRYYDQKTVINEAGETENVGEPEFNLQRLKDDGLGHMLKEIVRTKHGAYPRFHSSQDALNTLAKHFGLLIERVQVQHNIDISSITDKAVLRAIADGTYKG